MSTRLVRALAATLAVALSFVLMPGSAYADAADLRNPTISVTLTEITGGTHVCGDGNSPVAGSWNMSINGVRSNPSNLQVTGTAASPPLATFHACIDVWHNGPTGWFYVDAAFLGATAGTVVVRPGAAHGFVLWVIGEPDFHATSGDGGFLTPPDQIP